MARLAGWRAARQRRARGQAGSQQHARRRSACGRPIDLPPAGNHPEASFSTSELPVAKERVGDLVGVWLGVSYYSVDGVITGRLSSGGQLGGQLSPNQRVFLSLRTIAKNMK